MLRAGELTYLCVALSLMRSGEQDELRVSSTSWRHILPGVICQSPSCSRAILVLRSTEAEFRATFHASITHRDLPPQLAAEAGDIALLLLLSRNDLALVSIATSCCAKNSRWVCSLKSSRALALMNPFLHSSRDRLCLPH